MTLTRKFIFVLLLLALASCAKTDTSAPAAIDRAERACEAEQYGLAQNVCDSILSDCPYDSLSIRDLCRLSLVLMRLADNSQNDQANTVAAARCFHTAVARNQDSTAMVVNSMPPEAIARIMILNIISETSTRRGNDTTDIVADTIPADYFPAELLNDNYEENR